MATTADSPPSAHPLSPRALFRALPRAVDNRPIWAQLNITWRCNLSCAYCTEYDNDKGHVPYEQLVARIDKCRALGVLHTDLIGGEPLLHPDVTRLVADVVARGMTTGMTTNGFLLTAPLLAELKQAGLGRLQMSVDAVHPTEAAPKSLKTLKKKIDLCAQQGLWLWVNTVICDETLDDVEEVARFCFERDVHVNFSVVHDRGRLRRRLNNGRYLEKLRWLRAEKKAGRPVATPYYLLDYYEQTLSGKPPKWTCQAGQKSFYVSPEGNFHFCYHVPSAMELDAVTPSDLAGWGRAKGCESGCGVDCCVQTSLPFSKTLSTVSSEVRGRFGGLVGAVRAHLPIVS